MGSLAFYAEQMIATMNQGAELPMAALMFDYSLSAGLYNHQAPQDSVDTGASADQRNTIGA
jgi:hypothetical protein